MRPPSQVLRQRSPDSTEPWLQALLECIQHHLPGPCLVGGSSARALLDWVLYGEELVLRDLDLYLLGPGGTRALERLAEALEDSWLAFSGPRPSVRPKVRANPALPVPERNQYQAGFGLHLVAPTRPIVSLGWMRSLEDLRLNGLFDIDTVYLALAPGRPLAELGDSRYRLDEHGGYQAWRRRDPAILHWAEVERCYLRHAVRVVRTLARVGRLDVTEEWKATFLSHRPPWAQVDSPDELLRDLIKLLGDDAWAQELALLDSLGLLRELAPPLARASPAIPPAPGQTRAERARHRAQHLLGSQDDLEARRLLQGLLRALPTAFPA